MTDEAATIEQRVPLTLEEIQDLRNQYSGNHPVINALDELLQKRRERDALTEILDRHAATLEIANYESMTAHDLTIKILARYGMMNREVGEVKKVVTAAQEEQKYYWAGFPLSQNVSTLYRHMEHKVWRAEQQFKHFREDMQVWSRAIAIVAESIGNAGTHREKDARIRGMVEMIEGAVQSIRASRDEDDAHGVRFPDHFKSDYPVREYKDRIYQLEAEIKRLSSKPDDDETENDE